MKYKELLKRAGFTSGALAGGIIGGAIGTGDALYQMGLNATDGKYHPNFIYSSSTSEGQLARTKSYNDANIRLADEKHMSDLYQALGSGLTKGVTVGAGVGGIVGLVEDWLKSHRQAREMRG